MQRHLVTILSTSVFNDFILQYKADIPLKFECVANQVLKHPKHVLSFCMAE